MTEADQCDILFERNYAEVVIWWKSVFGFLWSDPDIILVGSSTFEFFGLEGKSVLIGSDLFRVPCGGEDEVFTDNQTHADCFSLDST